MSSRLFTLARRCPSQVHRATIVQRRWQQTLPPKPAMTSNPTVAAFRVVGQQVKVTLKYTGLTAVCLALTTAIAWQSYHLYIENYRESTPSELSYRARNFLHGAYVREHIAPDYQVAANYVRHALDLALETLDESSDIVIQLRLRLANDENRAGNVLDAITEYTRVWKWAPSAAIAKKLGDLYMRIGDWEQAEAFLTVAFQQDANALTMCSLASVYAAQGQYKLALPLLLQALKSVAEHEVCLRGIVQNQLCEVMYGMGKAEEALGWAQASLESCGSKADQDCRECGGVVSNNLGRLLELKGEFEKALWHYKQAITYAASSSDAAGQQQYETNAQRLMEQLSQERHQGATSLSAVTSAIEGSETKEEASGSHWLNSLLKK